MQNKPNFQKSQMNVTSLVAMDYENIANWTLGENKPNSKPIKPNLVRHSLGEGGTNPKQTQFQRQKNAAAFDD